MPWLHFMQCNAYFRCNVRRPIVDIIFTASQKAYQARDAEGRLIEERHEELLGANGTNFRGENYDEPAFLEVLAAVVRHNDATASRAKKKLADTKEVGRHRPCTVALIRHALA
jgi:hypothetical protein